MVKKITTVFVTGLATLALVSGTVTNAQASLNSTFRTAKRATYKYKRYVHSQKTTNQTSTSEHPTKELADTVMTPSVKKKLGNNVKWNGNGAYIVNDNHTNLVAKNGRKPYAQNKLDKYKRPTTANALLNKTSRQYRNRAETGNGASNWRPQGFMQVSHLSGAYSHAYDRGHLLGYALVGNIKGFDASESNPKNIVTQTAWSNEARGETNTGQNYYEGLVRKGLDQNKTIRYRVTPIYSGGNVVPNGMHLEAKSSDNSVQYNVFVPNVQNGITINYATGKVLVK